MDSSYSSLFFLLIVIIVLFIYYSEINDPNNIVNGTPTSYLKWAFLLLLIIGELTTAITLNMNNGSSDSQSNLKICIAVLLTWFLLFTPNIYLYYFSEKSNDFYGKSSFYINSIFENFIGYYAVSNEANKIFLKLSLIEDDITDDKILIELKKLIVDWNNDRSKLINQFNIFNFNNMWNKYFEPLFKLNEGNGKGNNLEETKKILFDLVKRKYVIGKCIWFFYELVLCLSISLYLIII
jgi:hypothetical protein